MAKKEMDFDFDLGLEPLKQSYNTYFKAELFKKREYLRDYSKNKIALGRRQDGRVYYIDTSEAFRMLVVGLTRTGKTFLLRGFGDRAIKSGFCVCYLPDVKDEFKSSIDPVQSKFIKDLLPGEKPTSTNVATFRPTFFRNVRGYTELPNNNYWYTPNLSDLSEMDFNTLMNVDNLTDPQKIAVKEIYEKVKDVISEISLEMINGFIDELEDFDDRQKMSLRTKFLPLKYSYILDDTKKGADFKRMINAGMVPALNMEGFDNITREGAGLPQVFVSIWLRKIINLRRKRLIPSIVIITDEASRFIPVEGNPSCKIEFMESVDLDTRYGVYYIFATQTPTKVPADIIKQCKYMLIPYNASPETFTYLFKISGVVDWAANVYRQRCALLKKRMKRYEWVIIDRNINDYTIIKSVAPLSCHAETTI